MNIRNVIILVALIFIHSSVNADEGLYGVWSPTTYINQGKELPVRGIMIITPEYFMANTTFDFDEDGVPEANANSGPIVVEDGVIKLKQWMQLHWRTKDAEENFLTIDEPEDIVYTIQDEKLIFHFPSGNTYISERLSGNVEE